MLGLGLDTILELIRNLRLVLKTGLWIVLGLG